MPSPRKYDLVVVGAGPAGVAAACVASECGLRVGVVDDNPAPGGQIWRAHTRHQWLRRFQRTSAELLAETQIVDQPEREVLLAEAADGAFEVQYRKLIIATGAREIFLPFPGWTDPAVVGAGGLQALVKAGLPVAGKRIVVAGSGPLLLAVAAYLRGRGATILTIAEQAPFGKLIRIAKHPGKLMQAAALAGGLLGSRYRTECWAEAFEHGAVTLNQHGRTWTEGCDYLACSFGLVPNIELATLLGCAIQAGFVKVDRWQQTSLAGVYCAGEPTGIGGLDLAVTGGQIAGYHAAGREAEARRLFGSRERALRFKNTLDRAFSLRPELKSLAKPDTIVCRCEDVPLGRIAGEGSLRAAKLQTRCGMGPCQGRVCGPALELLLGWKSDSVRPPVFPCRVSTLSGRAR